MIRTAACNKQTLIYDSPRLTELLFNFQYVDCGQCTCEWTKIQRIRACTKLAKIAYFQCVCCT